jgi:hypothetical protein
MENGCTLSALLALWVVPSGRGTADRQTDRQTERGSKAAAAMDHVESFLQYSSFLLPHCRRLQNVSVNS